MRLSEVVSVAPIEAIVEQSLSVTRIDTDHWEELARHDPQGTYGIAGRAWHLAVTAPQARLNPQRLAKYFDNEDPALAGAVEQVTGRPVFHDCGFFEATIEYEGSPFVVATSVVAHMTAGELYWYDIGLADPRFPLSAANRRSPSHGFKGYGLLSDVTDCVIQAARERGCAVVCLPAAYKPLVRVFERVGFAIEEGPLARAALATGMSIPMRRSVEL